MLASHVGGDRKPLVIVFESQTVTAPHVNGKDPVGLGFGESPLSRLRLAHLSLLIYCMEPPHQ